MNQYIRKKAARRAARIACEELRGGAATVEVRASRSRSGWRPYQGRDAARIRARVAEEMRVPLRCVTVEFSGDFTRPAKRRLYSAVTVTYTSPYALYLDSGRSAARSAASR